jgi:3-oxoacyl-[acyl-carrier protein] reductase
MVTPLLGRVAIITGGSKGIGRAIARALAAAGAAVVINYASDAKSATEAAKEIGKDRALAVQADASTLQGVEAIVNATIERFGRLDILVANAGMPFLIKYWSFCYRADNLAARSGTTYAGLCRNH